MKKTTIIIAILFIVLMIYTIIFYIKQYDKRMDMRHKYSQELYYAVLDDNIDEIKRLIDLGADLEDDDVDSLALNILEIAEEQSNYETFIFLYENSKKYNLKLNGENPFIYFVEKCNRDIKYKKYVEYFISNGIDKNIKSSEGRSVYEISNDNEIKELLKMNGFK